MDSNPTSPVSLSPSTPRSFAHSEDAADPRSPLLSPLAYHLDHPDQPDQPDQPDASLTADPNNVSTTHDPSKTASPKTASMTASPTTGLPKTVAPTAGSSAHHPEVVDEKKGDVKKTGEGGGAISEAVSLDEYDTNGERTVVDYYINEAGQYIKRTRVMRLVRKTMRVNKKVTERRRWSKMGDCAGLPPGPEPNITTKSSELVHLNLRPKVPSPDGLEPEPNENEAKGKDQKGTFAAVLQQNEGKVVVCSYCRQPGHWSLKCPQRSNMAPPSNAASATSNFPSLDKPNNTVSESGVYIPSYLRGKPRHIQSEGGGSQWERNEGPTVRITNLSEAANEGDLRDLCRPFGLVSRVYLAKDQTTGKSRGFAFVTFEDKEHGQQAIDRLHRHPYGNLLLAVEWAKPRAPNNQQPNQPQNNTAASAAALPPKRKTFFSHRK